MADRLKTLEEALEGKLGWPNKEDLEQKRLFEPEEKLNEIREALEGRRWCVLVGPPRSGKTTMARLVAWKENEEKKKVVRYLDICELLSQEDLDHSVRFPDNVYRLYIIENYHTQPWYRLPVLKAAKECRKARFLFTRTIFPDEEESEITKEFGDVAIVKMLPGEMVKGVIEEYKKGKIIRDEHRRNEFLRLSQDAPQENLSFSDKDYMEALLAPKEEKKIKGNLRYLYHRLEAWNPKKCHLLDVSVEEVRHHFREWGDKISLESPFLIKVAAVSQWDIPFRLKRGENYPKDVVKLMQENLLVQIPPDGLRMDSTDAYLFLRAYYDVAQWAKETADYLRDYLKDHPDDPELFVSLFWNLQAQRGTPTIVRLLDDTEAGRIIKKELADFLGEERAKTTRFYLVKNLINCLVAEAHVEEEKAKRFTKVKDLLSEVRAETLAETAKGITLQNKTWLMKHFLGDPQHRFSDFLKTFFASLGLVELKAEIEEAPGGNQRRFLNYLNHIDPALAKSLKSTVSLKPQPEKRAMGTRLVWLMHGLMESGTLREEKIQWLRSIDKDILSDKILHHSKKPVMALGGLLYSARWLDAEQANGIAGWIPDILASIPEHKDAEPLSLLIRNCRMANRGATERLLTALFEETPDTLLPLEEQTRLGTIGYLLFEAGQVNRDSLAHWCAQAIGYWEQVVTISSEREASHILTQLCRFAPDVASRVIESTKEQLHARLSARFNAMNIPLRGILALHGIVSANVAPFPTDEAIRELVGKVSTAELVLAIYGVQETFGIDTAGKLAKELAISPNVSPILGLNLARHAAHWTAENANQILNDLVSWQISDVEDALHNVVLFSLTYLVKSSMLQEGASIEELEMALEQDSGWGNPPLAQQAFPEKPPAVKRSTQWLQKAIHKGILSKQGVSEGTIEARWYINQEHPLVCRVVDKVRKVVSALQKAEEKYGQADLQDWDRILREAELDIPEADYWRSRLRAVGAIRYTPQGFEKPYAMKFTLVPEHPLALHIAC